LLLVMGASEEVTLLACFCAMEQKNARSFSIPFDGSIDFSLDDSTVGNYFHRRTL